MRLDTVLDILKALPGVYVDEYTLTREYDARSRLHVEISVDEQPEPDRLVITIEPGAQPDRIVVPPGAYFESPGGARTYVDPAGAPISLTSCAGCGRPGQYTRSKYCTKCRAKRDAGVPLR
jgi:hypothetical protein